MLVVTSSCSGISRIPTKRIRQTWLLHLAKEMYGLLKTNSSALIYTCTAPEVGTDRKEDLDTPYTTRETTASKAETFFVSSRYIKLKLTEKSPQIQLSGPITYWALTLLTCVG